MYFNDSFQQFGCFLTANVPLHALHTDHFAQHLQVKCCKALHFPRFWHHLSLLHFPSRHLTILEMQLRSQAKKVPLLTPLSTFSATGISWFG